jgi:hypothetical protein
MASLPALTVSQAFQTFDDNLKLEPLEARKARSRRDDITAILIAAGVAASTFGQGSFARKTMRKPLKDVDLVIVLNESLRALLFWMPGGAQRAMDLIRAAVAVKYPSARFDVTASAAHALQVTFDDCPFTFDLVPAFDVADSEDVDIADRERDAWDRENTRTLTRLVAERNQATGGVFVHQVRMGKSLKNQVPELDMCSLAIESLCYAVITERIPPDQAMFAVFLHAATAVYGPVLDPTGRDDLSTEWTQQQRHAYAQVFTSAARKGGEAVRLHQAGDHTAAIELWHSVFGDDFPAVPVQSVSQALTGLAAGSVTIAGRAVPSRIGGQTMRPTRSWSSH